MYPMSLARGLSFGSSNISYLLQDEFSTARAAGAVNGTPAEPGPGTRTVVDTNGIMSTAGGVLVVNGTTAANDRFHLGGVTRTVGTVHKIKFPSVTTVAGTGVERFGFQVNGTTDSSGVPGLDYAATTSVRIRDNGSVKYTFVIGAAPHSFAFVLRATGGFVFSLFGGNWVILYIAPTDSTASVFPKFIKTSATNTNLTIDEFRVPSNLYIPTPLCYDTFQRSNGALGNTETTGPDGQATPAKAWTGATWTISTNKAINTPNLGTDVVVNGNMETGNPPSTWTYDVATASAAADERTGGSGAQSMDLITSGGVSSAYQIVPGAIGTWWYMTGWGKIVAGTPAPKLRAYQNAGAFLECGLSAAATSSWTSLSMSFRTLTADDFGIQVFNSTSGVGDEARYDDVVVKQLTLSTLFSSVNVQSTADVHARVAITLDAATGGKQSGLVLNLDSTSSPANFIIAYLNGRGQAVLDECVAGTYTNKISAAVTYSAGAYLYVIRRGTSCWLFYNNAQCGSVQTMTANTNKLFGLFSTSPLCSLDAFEVWPDGGNGEHAILGSY